MNVAHKLMMLSITSIFMCMRGSDFTANSGDKPSRVVVMYNTK